MNVHKVFKFKQPILNTARKRIEKIVHASDCRLSCLIVGVQIRRGDFLDKRNRDFGFIVPSERYIQRAMNWYRAHFSTIRLIFLLLGSDYNWTNQHFGNLSDVLILKAEKPEDDLCLLSFCNHSVITVGTFGWWSAMLAGGEVVYSKEYVRKGSRFFRQFAPNDYFPPSWIGL